MGRKRNCSMHDQADICTTCNPAAGAFSIIRMFGQIHSSCVNLVFVVCITRLGIKNHRSSITCGSPGVAPRCPNPATQGLPSLLISPHRRRRMSPGKARAAAAVGLCACVNGPDLEVLWDRPGASCVGEGWRRRRCADMGRLMWRVCSQPWAV